MSLSKPAQKALSKAGYETPTPIQAQLVPLALTGRDVMGQARTGTGKTAAFLLPLLDALDLTGDAGDPQGLVLVPTRELAQQVIDEALKLSRGRSIHLALICGGKPMRRQISELDEGVDVVVGTPGRIIDHLGRKTLNLENVRCVVLDEADRMLDIGFRPDIEKILRRCPKERQTLLLSATVPPAVERLATRYMTDPEIVNASEGDVAVETIEQFYITTDHDRKQELLIRLLEREDPQQAIIFCRTKRGTDRLTLQLKRKFQNVSSLHGDMQQRVRDREMESFRNGKVRILVATDVVGRGIDVSAISHIVNYDIPEFCDDYVHRVGRTGRMGRSGVAYTFATPEEGKQLTNIEMRINRLLKPSEIEGFQAVRKPVEVAPDAEQEAAPAVKSKSAGLLGRGRSRRVRRAL